MFHVPDGSVEDCPSCAQVLNGLENIDDDADRQDVRLIKTSDPEFIVERAGLDAGSLPSLVFYCDGGVPNLFEGDLTAEEEVLDWVIEMKVEHHVENVNRRMLEDLITNTQYLAAYFGVYDSFSIYRWNGEVATNSNYFIPFCLI